MLASVSSLPPGARGSMRHIPEAATAQRADADTARGEAVRDAEQLRAELAQVRQQLDETQRQAEQARALAEEADRARVRAEATSDTLRELLDAFRSSGQADEDK